MKRPDDDFARFIAAARRGQQRDAARATEAPAPEPGFATRVAARWKESRRESWLLGALDGLALPVAAIALIVCVGAGVFLRSDGSSDVQLADELAAFIERPDLDARF